MRVQVGLGKSCNVCTYWDTNVVFHEELSREEEEFLDQGRESAKQREKPLPLTITGNKPM